jgi:hypothetical protein
MFPKAGKVPVNPAIFINKSLLDWKPAVLSLIQDLIIEVVRYGGLLILVF